VNSASELARIVNTEIRAVADSFEVEGHAEALYPFMCEDGCGEKVQLTLAAYIAANGAWLDGHKPE